MKSWYENGELYRSDMFIAIGPDGSKYYWCANGKWHTEQEFIEWQELQKAIAQGCKQANMNVDF